MSTETIERKVSTFRDLREKKLKISFDVRFLDNILAFIYKPSTLRTRKTLTNIYKLFQIIDDSIYEGRDNLTQRIWLIRKTLYAKLKKDFENDDLIKTYCLEETDDTMVLIPEIIDHIDNLKISHDESKYLIKQIEDRLMFGYATILKEEAENLFRRIDIGDFKTYKSVSDDLYSMAATIINNKRNVSSLDSDQTFSLRDDDFDTIVTDSVNKLKDKNRMYTTGIKRWNTILGPAYLSKRLYTYLAFPGGGKSQILLKSALDIKKYNGHVKAKDPSKIPTVLYITMENDIDETVERIFNMVGNADDIRNYTPKQVIKKLKTMGGLTITEENGIDIMIKYYPNNSIDTNDLYGIIQDLYDDGSEVIALILDYLKRIKPACKGQTEKEDLKNITNELKTLAKIKDIPVITAQQLNRAASTVIDSALQAKKEDVTRLIGKDGVAGAWEINTMVSPYREISKNNPINCGDVLVIIRIY